MALSALAKNIRRFYELNTQRKAFEKEEDALKDFFKAEAAGADTEFVYKDLVVSVSTEPRTGVDLKALRLELGDKIKAYETTSDVRKVCVRKKEA